MHKVHKQYTFKLDFPSLANNGRFKLTWIFYLSGLDQEGTQTCCLPTAIQTIKKNNSVLFTSYVQEVQFVDFLHFSSWFLLSNSLVIFPSRSQSFPGPYTETLISQKSCPALSTRSPKWSEVLQASALTTLLILLSLGLNWSRCFMAVSSNQCVFTESSVVKLIQLEVFFTTICT